MTSFMCDFFYLDHFLRTVLNFFHILVRISFNIFIFLFEMQLNISNKNITKSLKDPFRNVLKKSKNLTF